MIKSGIIVLAAMIFFGHLASASFFHNHWTNLYVSVIKHNIANDRSESGNDFSPVLDDKYGPFFMKMPMDHFDKRNTKVFDNRFWVNTDYYKPKGPLILYNVGESAADDSAILVTYSVMAQLAKKLNGVVVIMEHRFYGTSGSNVTLFFDYTKEDLLTFNSKQAVADMAYLTKSIKFHGITVPPVPQTKAVVYGCSYSGALAAWVKDTYPELFFAAVSSSAPVEAKMNFFEYYVPIMRFGPKTCISALQNVIEYIDNILFANSTEDVIALKKIFNAQNLLDESFAELLMGDISGSWQYGINSTNNQFVETICKCFPNQPSTNNNTTVHKDLLSYASYINSYSTNVYCRDGATSLDKCLVESNFTATSNLALVSNTNAAWTWQTCNEFGYFQASPPSDLPTIISRKFGLSYFTNICQRYFKKFNVPATPNVNSVNDKYKGWDIQLNRTIWIDGEWDSWRELSVNSLSREQIFEKDTQQISIIIPKSTHCSNVNVVNDKSPQYLKDAFEQQYQTLKNWLADEY